jgi:SAM-dependent methyltransferase
LRFSLGERADVGAIGQHAEAWTEYWQDQHEGSGCCANAPEIQRPIRDHWTTFAQSLAAGARVLDLGCGTGAAGRVLVSANPSLRVTGIDFAAVPESGDPNIDILANTRMENLPLADASFDGAVSQFGIEYASIPEASRELARVLRPGAPISFLIHHRGARIVVDSVPHRKTLAAICGTALETAFLSGNAAALSRQLTLIRHQFPHERIVDEAAQGLCRHIGLAPAQRAEIWRAVRAALAPELGMLADLQAASVSPDEMPSWLKSFAARFELQPPAGLAMTSGQPLCWKVEGVRRATLH